LKPERVLTFRDQIILFWGKVRRFYYHTCRPDYIARNHLRRRGECTRCGICCLMGSTCLHYSEDGDGQALCLRHPVRPRNCRIFPVDEADLRDRDILAPDTPCGYSFIPIGEPLTPEPAAPEPAAAELAAAEPVAPELAPSASASFESEATESEKLAVSD